MSEPKLIQRLTEQIEGSNMVAHKDGEFVEYWDHLRFVTLAKIEALECARRCIVCCAQVTAAEELALKIAALRKELEG